MITIWIKTILGINELENRLKLIEREKAHLESRVIGAENEKTALTTAVAQSVSSVELTQEVQNFLKQVNIHITEQNTEAALVALSAADVVKKYNFKRYVAPIEKGYDTRIITQKEFQEHPELYFHKLNKGFFNFPVGLYFSKINELLEESFDTKMNIKIEINSLYSNNGTFDFSLPSLLGLWGNSHPHAQKATDVLVQATELSRLRRVECGDWIQMDTLDFLVNYEGIREYVTNLPNVPLYAKKRAISVLEFTRFVYLTAMEIIGTTRIGTLSDLLRYNKAEDNQTEEISVTTGEWDIFDPNNQLKLKIKKSLLAKPKGTSDKELEQILPLRSRERFRQLASEVTSIILANDKERKGLTYGIDKPLNEYSVGECLVLACYFARNVITKYKSLEDSVADAFLGKSASDITGKCTDYTGLALHYLREYLVPMQPDKFRNWHFGVENDVIRSYQHSYIKALHINQDVTVDVYFLDPTMLANRGIGELKSPKTVIEGLDTSKHPLMIERDAEDLLYAAKEKMKK